MLDRLEVSLDVAMRSVAGLLIVAQVLLLVGGVLARYVFRVPLIWSDEVVSILFLWLTVIGATLSLGRRTHLRMTFLVDRLSPSLRSQAEALSAVILILLLIALIPASLRLYRVESVSVTPALGLPMGLRSAALPTGLVLMLLFAALDLRRHPPRCLVLGAGLAALLIVACGAMKPELVSLDAVGLALFFLLGAPLLLLIGLPIGYAFIAATSGYLLACTHIPVAVVVARLSAGMSEPLLLAIPLFVFLGHVIETTGLAGRMVRFLVGLVGHMKGGLHYVLIGSMYLISGISGSKAADMAAIAPSLFPTMERLGEDRAELSALLAATGAQTEAVPPSLLLITLGSVSGLSVSRLFRAGIMPSLFLALLLCIVVRVRAHGGRRPQRIGWSEIIARLGAALPVLALPFGIRAAVTDGVATATEVSTLGIVYTLVAALALERRLDVAAILRALGDTAALSGAILLIIGAATAMGWTITQSGFSRWVEEALRHMPGGELSFMLLSVALFAVLGTVLEGLPAIVLFGPITFPVARELGVDQIHYAIVVVLALSLGLFTPPFGIGYYVSCAIGRSSPDAALKHIWTYLMVLAAGILVIACLG